MVLIHGWPLSHKIFEYQTQLLVNCGYRVVLLDLRGFGASDSPAWGYCYDQMARDIYEVVRGMRLCDFVLGGFSMGGAIVLRYMRNYRGYGVRKLMLMAAAAPSWTMREGFPYGNTREAVNELICQAMTDRPQLARTFSHEQLFYSCHSEAVMDWFEDLSLSASGIGTVKSAVSLRDEDGRMDLCSVHVPTAVFQGDHDVVVPEELTLCQYESIPGAVLYRLEHSGHGVFYDELDKFNDYMMEFLQTC